MKKILIRAHMSPFDNWNAEQVLKHDRVGTNAGNMIFTNSLMRTLMTEDVQIDTFNTRRDLTPENLERINSEYSCVVLPFANAFRTTFQRELQSITKFVKQLKIPCVVAGIGVSASFANPLKEKNSFDDAAKDFLKVILDKSALIGTRGEVTGEYLKKLGFQEESHYRVIGCPSMYWYGEQLPYIEKHELTSQSPVSVNWKIDLPEPIHVFMRENMAKFENIQYVPQIMDEMRLMYYGTPFPSGKYKKITENYPSRPDHPLYTGGKAVSFINPQTWFAYMQEKQFSFGSRIHGNITALLSGTPSYVIVSDYRISELVEYHNIPHINFQDLKEGDDIFSLYEKADYSKLYDGHQKRFENYIQFLEKNGLDHIFKENRYQAGFASAQNSVEVVSGAIPAEDVEVRAASQEPLLCPYDRKMVSMDLQPALYPFFSVPVEEQARRLMEVQKAYTALQRRFDDVKSLETILKLYRMDKGVKWLLKKFKK